MTIYERIKTERRRDFDLRAKMASNDDWLRNVRRMFSAECSKIK